MTFIAKVNDIGSFIATVNDSAAINVTLAGQGEFVASMSAIGPSGLLTADAPLIYDSVLKNLSIDLSAYLTVSDAAATYQTLAGMSLYRDRKSVV
jgi:hypothetical protein